MVKELTEKLQVDEEVSIAAEKLGLPLDNGAENESEESDYFSDLSIYLSLVWFSVCLPLRKGSFNHW